MTWAPPELCNCFFNEIFWCFRSAILAFFSCGSLACWNKLTRKHVFMPLLKYCHAATKSCKEMCTNVEHWSRRTTRNLSSYRVLFFCSFSKLNKSLWLQALPLPCSSLWVMQCYIKRTLQRSSEFIWNWIVVQMGFTVREHEKKEKEIQYGVDAVNGGKDSCVRNYELD